jgi:hypothetical protein
VEAAANQKITVQAVSAIALIAVFVFKSARQALIFGMDCNTCVLAAVRALMPVIK